MGGRWMVLCLLAACGRIDFDPIGGVSDGGLPRGDGQGATLVFRDGLDGYTGTVDTYLSLADPTADEHMLDYVLWHDDTPTLQSQQHALLRFDAIFGPTAIPRGSTMVSASLRLVITDACTGGPAGTISESALDWGSTAAWNTFGATPGVQPEDVRGSAIAAAPTEAGVATIDVTASLSAWAADPTLNNGWIISPFPSNSDACSVSSSEVLDDLSRPELTVSFVTP